MKDLSSKESTDLRDSLVEDAVNSGDIGSTVMVELGKDGSRCEKEIVGGRIDRELQWQEGHFFLHEHPDGAWS